MKPSAHSKDFFTSSRNDWWNQDFLLLFRKRWNLAKVKHVLDVGCGVGHWTQALSSLFTTPTRFTCVDLEREHIRKAKKRFFGLASKHSFVFKQANAMHLPFPDNSFDMVTCQTLLIHLSDPIKCILEMKRVLKPNGLIAVCEPNNLFQAVSLSSTDLTVLRQRIGLEIACQIGKMKTGNGFDSYGELAVADFNSAGLEDIQVYISDKCMYLIPPYSEPNQQTYIQEIKSNCSASTSLLSRQKLRFAAHGGRTAKQLRNDIKRSKLTNAGILKSIENNQLCYAGVAIMIITSGRKSKRL